jgi:hypothetical protein
MDNYSVPNSDKCLGWKTLGGYGILFIAVTIAYALWAVGIRTVSLQLNVPAFISHTLNRLGGGLSL